MIVKLTKIETNVIIGGFSIETSLENSTKDVEMLYHDFTHNGKIEILSSITKNKHEYYAVIWYTKLHEKYMYLLGQKLNEKIDNLDIKDIKTEVYAFTKFPPKYDGIKAWTNFYNEGIPKIGYKPIGHNDIAF
jgi:hypothetical protein